MSDQRVPATAAAAIPSDPQAIERAIEERQVRLAATVDELTTRLSPRTVVARTRADVVTRARDAVLLPDGSLRVERIAAVGAAVLGLVTLLVVRGVRGR